MHALVPHLELRMPRLDQPRAAVRVIPFLDLLLILDGNDVFNPQSLRPWKRQPLVRWLEVIRHVALAADIRPHLLPRSHRVHVVVLHALGGFQRANAFDERRARDAQLHRFRIMTVDAGHRVLHVLANLRIRHVRIADHVETLHHVAVTQLQVGRHHGRMAVDAHGRRIERLPAGERLVVEHVRVAAALPIIRGERIPCPHCLQPRIFLQLRAGHYRSRIGIRRRVRHGLAAAVLGALHVDGSHVEVILQREVLCPDCRDRR